MATYEQRVYTTALHDGMPDLLALFIVAQSKHESANYNSRIFKLTNNAFGYSYVPGAKYQLPTHGPVADNGAAVATYKDIENSTHEITAWIKRRQNNGKFPKDLTLITTAEQYATLLKNSGYYSDTVNNYLRGLVYWFKSNIAPITGGAAIAALILFFF